MSTLDYAARSILEKTRVPDSLAPGVYGAWEIVRVSIPDNHPKRREVGWPSMTSLHRHTMATLHLRYGDVVMEDSISELRRHLPVLMSARGRVLVSGLGLGCVVRGLLANPAVLSVDVVEIDSIILSLIGAEFRGAERVCLRRGDALKAEWPPDMRWDFAWHDIWTEDGNGLPLCRLHLELIAKYRRRVPRQGAWALPREVKRMIPGIIG